jgi:putative endonuclease
MNNLEITMARPDWQPCVYILANEHRTLYIGVTNNVWRRVWEHRQPGGNTFTHRYAIHRLVYLAQFERMDDAIAWEKTLKGKTRARKLALINEPNPRWNDLAWNWFASDEDVLEPAP